MTSITRQAPVLRNVDVQSPSKVLPRPRHPAPRQAQAANAAKDLLVPPPLPEMPAADVAAAIARGRQEGYDKGLHEGLKDAERQAAEHLRSQTAKLEAQVQAHMDALTKEHAHRIERIDALLQDLEASTAAHLADLEPAVVALAYEAICRLLGEQAARQETLAALVANGVQQLRGGTLLRIRMHPADLALLTEHPQHRSITELHPTVQWEADATAAPGRCMLATDRGSLDASLHTQLQRLRELWSSESKE